MYWEVGIKMDGVSGVYNCTPTALGATYLESCGRACTRHGTSIVSRQAH